MEYRFPIRALTQSVGQNDTSHDGRLCRGCATRAFGTLKWLMGLLRLTLAPLHLVTCGPAAIFAPHAVFVAGLCDNCLTACSCLPTAL